MSSREPIATLTACFPGNAPGHFPVLPWVAASGQIVHDDRSSEVLEIVGKEKKTRGRKEENSESEYFKTTKQPRATCLYLDRHQPGFGRARDHVNLSLQ